MSSWPEAFLRSCAWQYMTVSRTAALAAMHHMPVHNTHAVLVQGVLDSFLIEITSLILPTKDKMGDGFLVDKILDKTGMKGTGASPTRAHLLLS